MHASRINSILASLPSFLAREGDALMLAAGRRTYLPMSVLAGMLVVTLVAYILLYLKLSPPRTLTGEVGSSGSSKEVVPMHILVNRQCEVETREFEEREEKGGEEEEGEGVKREEKEVQNDGLDEYDGSMNEEETLL